MAQVHFFCDESGKFSSSRYVSFCGFLGTGTQGEKLLPEWSATRLRLQVPPIHVSAMLHPSAKNGWLQISQKWGDKWPGKRDEVIGEFATIIDKEKLVCFGAVIDVESFSKMDLPILKARSEGDPHYLAFELTVVGSLEKVLWGDSNGTMGLVMDDDEEKAIHCYKLLKMVKAHEPKVKERVSGICFGSDDLYPGIQAADILAHESRRMMTHDEAPSKRFQQLTCNGQHKPILLDAAMLQSMENEAREEYERRI